MTDAQLKEYMLEMTSSFDIPISSSDDALVQSFIYKTEPFTEEERESILSILEKYHVI